jgi:thiamine-phosphate pyrophosphorylase
MKGIYFVTDGNLSRAGIFSDVKNALKAGVGIVQYRNKEAATVEMIKEASKLRKICKGAKLIINDRIDIALAVGADGVHLGRSDMPYDAARKLLGKRRIIGLTVHNLSEAIDAERLGADYLGVAPIFSTKTKKDAGVACGPDMIRKIKKHVKIPLVAVGGINLSNAQKVISSGADCLCAIQAVVTKKDVKREIEKLQKLFQLS